MKKSDTKRKVSLVVIIAAQALLLTACNKGELEIVKNETYYGTNTVDQEVNSSTEENPVKIQNEKNTVEKEEPNKEQVQLGEEKQIQKESSPKIKENIKDIIKQKQKEKTTVTESITPPAAEQLASDWESTVQNIATANLTKEEKTKKLNGLIVDYSKNFSQENVNRFKTEMLDDFLNGQFTKAIGNDKAMLMYIFKTSVVANNTSKDKNYSQYVFATTYQEFLEELYLKSDKMTNSYIEKKINKLYQVYSTIDD